MLLAPVGCGGKARSELGSTTDDTGTEPRDAEPTPCECPSYPPWGSPECSCPGLECSYSRHFCWPGEVVCDGEGAWDFVYPELSECPERRPIELAFCDGVGSCSYEVDVGCGPVTLEAVCSCLDASYLIQYHGSPPALCDCTAIGERDLCERYPRECVWLETGSCETVDG